MKNSCVRYKKFYLRIVGAALIAGVSVSCAGSQAVKSSADNAAPDVRGGNDAQGGNNVRNGNDVLPVGSYVIPDRPEALPPKSDANPRGYTASMGAGNPEAIARLAAARGYNVLFITSDEHNAQMTGYERTLGFQTDIQTPNLDKLASEGAYFTHAYSACPLCAPARASIITGLYPTEHGVLNHNTVMPDQSTWADFFTGMGYYTGIIGKAHDNNPVTKSFGYQYVAKNSGVGVSDILKSPANLPPPEVPARDKPFYTEAANDLTNNEGHLRGGVLSDVLQDQDGMVVKLTKEFLDNNKSRKFFLHASFIAPHWPWNSPEKFYFMYDPDKIIMPKNPGPPVDLQPLNIYTREKWFNITPQMQRVFRARYMGALSWMDDNVGQILKKLDDLGLADKTLVIYSSDHGDMSSEKGMWFKMVMYEQSARVPLIIRMPGVIKAGTVNDTLINHVDYFPTIAGLTGNAQNLPDYLSGLDLTSAVLGITPGPDYVFSLRATPDKGAVPFAQMIRSAQYKLIRYNGGGDKEFTLYDIKNDPYEDNDLIDDPAYKAIADTHIKALEEFMGSLRYSNYQVKNIRGEL